ncbi:amino acid adenylation domain-containing protein [Aporhodopirellula aestuarii]|uniref:Amino acid adenylation domain-containing protein n=1 Tax=Aporhodopirellula aestuarii TaxID=2950107 RepID=A0ABT0U320_9BACT|nr:non-ribosomal peptide synthetase [Aporhodopirellula aestuarii]MCM2370991.1 amino acid adenylation domain-containing protein [Aporhodopirellula aestuarii]
MDAKCDTMQCQESLDGDRLQQQIHAWNQTDEPWQDDPCLHEMFAEQSRRTPDSVAVICGDCELTYGELDEQSTRVAGKLIELGVAAEEVVGVVLDDLPSAYIGILGILKAGAAYLPLNPSFPSDRIAFFLREAETRFVVGTLEAAVLEEMPCLGTVGLNDLPEVSLESLPRVSPASLAYVLFTSGSTGKPKGVMLNHRGPVNTIRDINTRFRVNESDRVLALSSLGFDLSVYDLFGMLSVGATIVLPTSHEVRNPGSWQTLIERHQVTLWNTVPALMEMLVTYLDRSKLLPSLRLVMLSGDWIPVTLPGRIREVAPDAKLVSLGGSTEVSIWSVIYAIDAIDPEWSSIPYGKPLRNQRCYVVDENRQLCKIGETGELCLGGAGVAVGYLNRPDLTEQQFVSDPFEVGGTLYRTGDLCRYHDDGNLEFLGRKDHQVKIHGYRIGLGEIEAEITKLHEVRDAVVAASDEKAGSRLIAYVVFEKGHGMTLAKLKASLSRSLPDYMLPSALVPIGELPLTSNGKVDRKALPSPNQSCRPSPVAHSASETEAFVSETLCELLHLPSIDPSVGFMELGGNSLAAVALAARIKARYGVRLEFWGILANSLNTIEMSKAIDELSHQASASDHAETAMSRERLVTAPLSSHQQQLWIEHFLIHNRGRYNIPLVYDLEGELDTRVLEEACTCLVERHEILRTVYESTDSGLLQRVQPTVPFKIERVDLRGCDAGTRRQVLEARSKEFASVPFQLSSDAPFRAVLYQLAANEFRFVLVVHHIAFDGHSIGVLHRDLAAFYDAIKHHRSPELRPLEHQYANYSVWQQRHHHSESLAKHREFWRASLDGELPVLDLPTDDCLVDEALCDTISLKIEGELLDAARTFSSRRQSTLFVTLLSAIKAVFYRYTRQEDMIIGSAMTTRDDLATEDLIGYFINVLPLRTRFDGGGTFEELQRKVRETAFNAFAHQNYPFELLKKEILSNQETGGTPFRVLFILENEAEPLELSGLKSKPVALETQMAKFDLLIAVNESSGYLRIDLQYRSKLFQRTRMERFAEHLPSLLSAAIANPMCPVDQLEMLSPEERDVVLPPRLTKVSLANENVGVDEAFDQPASVLSLYNAQVQRTPGLPAVSFAGQTLTYRELDERATRFASRLVQHGVVPDAPVAVSIDRSFDMLVAVLGVLKAGGCYVPMDPALPAQRRQQMLQRCGARMVVTTTGLADDLNLDDSGVAAIWVDSDAISVNPLEHVCFPELGPDHLAYVLYTSGSTGEPKGVAMRHGALANLMRWQLPNSEAAPSTKTLQFASLGFDVSFQEIFATLCSGGELLLISNEMQRDLHQLWHFIVESGTERIFVPFVVLRTLCEVAGESAQKSALREVVTAGERLEITPVVRDFFKRRPGCRLWNHYGPTETHVVTAYQLASDPTTWPAVPPIGQTIDNCVAVILDEKQQPVPQGVEGELYLGGQCLAQGYFADEVLTSERFVPNPHRELPTQRLYRTGDICRLNWDKQLEFIRRNDLQVKVRGHRVELNEIEVVLSRYPGVKQTVVTFERSGLGGQLIAHVLCDANTVSVCELEKYLSAQVPSYMMVSQFRLVDDFPYTASGKVDRKKLASIPSVTVSGDQTNLTELTTCDPLVNRLIRIWQSVLGVEGLDSRSNFFDCGGDSLSAAILFTRLEKEFGRAVSITKLVSSPTISDLAEVYRQDEARVDGYWNDLVPLDAFGPHERPLKQAPLFCFPGIDGHLVNFREIAAELGKERPVYGVEPLGLDGVSPPPDTIEEIARHHVQKIRRVMPHGPYHLAGFSFGGVVAYEVSQQLRRAGERVTLAIIDASTGLPIPAPLYQSLCFHLRYAKQCQGRQRWTYLYERVVAMMLAIKYRFGWITMEKRLERIIGTKGIYAKVAAKNMQVIDEYRPDTAEGPATLYKAKLRANWPGKDHADPLLGWGSVFDQERLEVVEVEGAHANMLSKHKLHGLVERLRREIVSIDRH